MGLKFKVKAIMTKEEWNRKTETREEFIHNEIARIAMRYKNNQDTYMRIWKKKTISVWKSQEQWITNMVVRIIDRTDKRYGLSEIDKSSYFDHIYYKLSELITQIEYTRDNANKEFSAIEMEVSEVYRKIILELARADKNRTEWINEEIIMNTAKAELLRFAERALISRYGKNKKEWVSKIFGEYKKAAMSCGR